MSYYKVHLLYFSKIFFYSKLIFTKPAGIVCLIAPAIVTLSFLNPMQKVLVLLFFLFILDFITGIYASWVETKAENAKAEEKTESRMKLFFGMISSAKLKLSGVKAFTYCFAILSIYFVEKIFFIKSFRFDRISDQDLTITIILAAFFCAIEMYSIFFENVKRAGFDIVDKVQKLRKVKKDLSEAE